MSNEREEWGAMVTNREFVDRGRVYPMESKRAAKRWAASRNEHAALNNKQSPRLVVVRRTITTTEWDWA